MHLRWIGRNIPIEDAKWVGGLLAQLKPAQIQDAFRAALPVDDATWARGRGWALSVGLIALPYHRKTNPFLAGIARRAIDEALDGAC